MPAVNPETSTVDWLNEPEELEVKAPFITKAPTALYKFQLVKLEPALV
jgi:hypothetical protein